MRSSLLALGAAPLGRLLTSESDPARDRLLLTAVLELALGLPRNDVDHLLDVVAGHQLSLRHEQGKPELSGSTAGLKAALDLCNR